MSAGGGMVQRLFRARTLQALGWGGSTAATRWAGATISGPPTTGTYAAGDWIVKQNGGICVCTVAGAPGTWLCTSATVTLTSPVRVTGLATQALITNSTADTRVTGLAVQVLITGG